MNVKLNVLLVFAFFTCVVADFIVICWPFSSGSQGFTDDVERRSHVQCAASTKQKSIFCGLVEPQEHLNDELHLQEFKAVRSVHGEDS